MINYRRTNCRLCGSKKLIAAVKLTPTPPADSYLKKNELSRILKEIPLTVMLCKGCGHSQLSHVINAKQVYLNYIYETASTLGLDNHFKKCADEVYKAYKPNKDGLVVDIGSNDGVALKPFKNLGFNKLLGVEPAKNLAKLANKNKIKTFNGFLEKKNLKKIKKNADLILASNVFAHSDKLKEMAECMFKLLSNKGTIIIEVQYLMNTLKDLTFDNIYHEHFNYWSLTSLVNFFKQLDAKIIKSEQFDTHGGSLRIYVKKDKKAKVEKSVKQMLKDEEKFGIKKFETYKKFGEKVYKIRENVRKNLKNLKKDNKLIIGYGAPAKATTALNFFGISNEIDFIVEDNKLKHNKFIPGVKIPIKNKSKIKSKKNTLIVLAWNFYRDIVKNNTNLSENFINIKDLETNN